MFIRATGDALDILWRQKLRTTQHRRASPDGRGFLRHEHRRQYRIGGTAKRDDAVIFQQNHAWNLLVLADKRIRAFANGLRQTQSRVSIWHKHRGAAAANNLIGKYTLPSKFRRARRASNLIYCNRMGVPDKFYF